MTKRLQQSSIAAFANKRAKRDDPPEEAPFHVFCDLDGVLVDFNKGAMQLLGGKHPDHVPKRQLFSAIRPEFFRSLPWTHDGPQLWKGLARDYSKGRIKLSILTGVPYSSYQKCGMNKFQWCERELVAKSPSSPKPLLWHVDRAASKKQHAGTTRRRKNRINVITCWSSNKHQECISSNCILIDDNEAIGTRWQQAGGIFVHHKDTETTLKILRQKGIAKGDDESSSNRPTSGTSK